MSAQILLVEDDPGIVDVIAFSLGAEGFSVEAAVTGAAGWEAAQAGTADLVILDVMLPDLSGFELCRRLRAISAVPIIMLTVRDSELDKVMGLEFGADDYVTKPFSIVEVISRVRALLRRRELDREQGDGLRRDLGYLTIDFRRHEVNVDGRAIELTPSEFRILALLSEMPGRVYSRDQIMESLWDVPFEGSQRACDVHIFHLRRKVERDPSSPTRIVTVRGVGYRLDIDARDTSSSPYSGGRHSTGRP